MLRTNDINFLNFVFGFLIEKDTAIMKMRNVGKITFSEYVDLKRMFERELLKIIHSSEEDFPREKLIIEKSKWFEYDFVYDFYRQQGHMPMFWILEQELKSDDTRAVDMLLHSYPILDNKEYLTIQKLGKKHNLSHQRIFQIKNKAYEHFFSQNNPFLQQMEEEWAFYQHSIKEDDIVWQDDERISALIEQEECHLTRRFILKMLSLLTHSTHTYMGRFAPQGKEKNWKSSVLIPVERIDFFDFNRFRDYIAQLISIHRMDKLIEYYCFGAFLMGAPGWKKFRDGIITEIEEVATGILLYEFDLPTISGSVVIPSHQVSSQKISDVLYDILKQQGEPMHINDIFTEFKKALPQHKYTAPAQLRNRLSKHEQIIHKGRKSTYMLKEWTHFKQGSIGDIIVDFLNERDTPQTIQDITDHVLQHYPETNKKSVLSIIYNGVGKRFIRFGKGEFGLNDKSYSVSAKIAEDTSDILFRERVAQLEKFLLRHWHFPFSISGDEEEILLYRWWKSQRFYFDKLGEEQKAEIERINNQYAGLYIEKRAYEWNNKYAILINFISDNQRTPSRDSTGMEKMLYDWHKKVKKDLKANKLDTEQERKAAMIEELLKE